MADQRGGWVKTNDEQLAKQLGLELIRFDYVEYMNVMRCLDWLVQPPADVVFDQGGLLTEGSAKNPIASVC